MKPKFDPDLFLQAAEIVDSEQQFACLVLEWDLDSPDAAEYFRETLGPPTGHPARNHTAFLSYSDDDELLDCEEIGRRRVLALLFAYWIARDES